MLLALSLTLLTTTGLRAQTSENYVGSYGEMKYQRMQDAGAPRLDFERFVLYFDHTFSPTWALRSETEIEHVKIEGGLGGEVGIEQAYLEYQPSPQFGWKTGLLVLPIGIMNQTHEPTTFYSVERPLFDQEIVPSTWRELGTGIYGAFFQALSYQCYLTEGLNARAVTETGLDGAKQEGSGVLGGAAVGSDATRPGLSARLQYEAMIGLKLGVSQYLQPGYSAGWSSGLSLADVYAEYEHTALRVRVEAARVSTGDASDGVAITGTGTDIPTALRGGYAEVAYDLLWSATSRARLVPFVRSETIEVTMPQPMFSSSSLPKTEVRHALLVGVAYSPLRGIIFKTDYRWMSGDLRGEHSGFSLGAGYEF